MKEFWGDLAVGYGGGVLLHLPDAVQGADAVVHPDAGREHHGRPGDLVHVAQLLPGHALPQLGHQPHPVQRHVVQVPGGLPQSAGTDVEPQATAAPSQPPEHVQHDHHVGRQQPQPQPQQHWHRQPHDHVVVGHQSPAGRRPGGRRPHYHQRHSPAGRRRQRQAHDADLRTTGNLFFSLSYLLNYSLVIHLNSFQIFFNFFFYFTIFLLFFYHFISIFLEFFFNFIFIHFNLIYSFSIFLLIFN